MDSSTIIFVYLVSMAIILGRLLYSSNRYEEPITPYIAIISIAFSAIPGLNTVVAAWVIITILLDFRR